MGGERSRSGSFVRSMESDGGMSAISVTSGNDCADERRRTAFDHSSFTALDTPGPRSHSQQERACVGSPINSVTQTRH